MSADQTYEAHGPISHMLAGMIEHGNNARIFNESIIELVRIREFPSEISRLHGMYFFGSAKDALERVGDKEWPTFFVEENLVEFELCPAQPPSVVDANWITHAPVDQDGRISVADWDWIRGYWSRKSMKENPIWEIVATGTAIALDASVRRRCYDTMTGLFPESEISLLMARLAGEAGTRGGLIVPWLTLDKDESFTLAYYFRDIEFHDQSVVASIRQHVDFGMLMALVANTPTWKLPDFRQWRRKFQLRLDQSERDLLAPISIHQVK